MSRAVQREQNTFEATGYEVPFSGSLVEEGRGNYPEYNQGISEEEYRFAMESIRRSDQQIENGEVISFEGMIEQAFAMIHSS